MMRLAAVILLALLAGRCRSASSSAATNSSDVASLPPVDYLIVGAGGGGIQTALSLQKHGHSVRILERDPHNLRRVGGFWTRYPRFDELISVNKWVRDETQRWRYDWHSFLDTPVRMWEKVSQRYFPSGREFHEYMNAVVDDAGIEVIYGVDVGSVASDGTPCVTLSDGTTVVCAKYRVFVATGLEERREPYLRAVGGVPYSRMTRELARNKRVCVLGNGNAAFEVAQNTYDVADRVFVLGKRPARLSAVTKYTGDVRVKFLQTLENFHGKLMDASYEPSYNFEGIGKELNATQYDELANVVGAALTVTLHECELLVLATGFRSSVPGMDLSHERFPDMTDWYAPPANPRVHYVGWLMHAFDFRRGAGGFLSGYRYLIRNLVHRVRELDHGVPYPSLVFSEVEDTVEHVMRRFQTSHDLVILQDGVVVRDAIVTVKKDDGAKEYHYYEGVTYQFHEKFRDDDGVIWLYLLWGDDRTAASVFDNVYQYADTKQLRNSKLHPTVEVNGMVREALEDIDMEWTDCNFDKPIRQIVKEALAEDYSKFYPKPNYTYVRQESYEAEDNKRPEVGEECGEDVYLTDLRKTVTKAILMGGTEDALQMVRDKARVTLKQLSMPLLEQRVMGNETMIDNSASLSTEADVMLAQLEKEKNALEAQINALKQKIGHVSDEL
mmetsp:Transcript_32211/g.68164  ORF Transcript_32211/g.68164 Transcript_32211/m.68164 type:complete len:669 (+) Transcript_32211:17-2023(+)